MQQRSNGKGRVLILAGVGSIFTAVALAASTPAVSSEAANLGQDVGATKVLKWHEGKRAVFMLEFDDSCQSHLKNAIPEMKKRGLVGTFYINPGNGPFKSKQAAWEKEVFEAGMELGNHTFTHSGAPDVAAFERELALSNDAIDKCLPGRKQPRLISYGPPGGIPKEKWGVSPAEIKQALVKYNLIERPNFFGPPMHLKSKEDVLKKVDQVLANGEMGHVDFHGVGGDWLVTPMDWFLPLLDKLVENRDQLWITDPISYHKYLTERKASEVKVLSSDKDQIRVQLTAATDPVLYDLPLTLETRVLATWPVCTVVQGKDSVQVASTNSVVRYAAMPGAGEIVIKMTGK